MTMDTNKRNTMINLKLILTVMIIIFLQCWEATSLSSAPAPSRCIFDEVQKHQNVERTLIKYHPGDVSAKSKRSVEEEANAYQPIRVKTFVQNEEHLMDSVQVEKLETIMAGATSVVQKLLSVYPVQGPLLIDRSEAACRTTYNGGQNDGKCAEISPNYREQCLDNFEIPDDHLEGLWTWDAINSEPAVTHFEEGSGIPNADVVLYVKAEHTTRCNSGDVFAYASFCKQDQFSRPIAGVINFCPDPLLSEEYDQDKFTLLALHEAFHVLGFSTSLFDQFQDCSVCEDGLECETREDVVRVDAGGQSRLHTPAVVAASQIHFGCTEEEEMGVPLENLGGEGVSSHWETRYMYGSVMAPAILQAHSTFLDNMTLAVFEDSGWYKVNYEYAGDFPWGKDQGCEFGSVEYCATNFTQFFCNESISGCDYLGLNKATCTTNIYLDGCKIYWPDSENQCVHSSSSVNLNETGEITGPDSRCFASNSLLEGTCTPGDLEGRCYATRCGNSSESYEIRLLDSDWIPCPAETSIQVPGYEGEVHCPPADIVCKNHSSLVSLVDQPCLTCTTPPATSTATTSTTQTSPGEVPGELNFSLVFNDLAYSEVDEGSEVNDFKGVLIGRIAETVQLTQNRIEILDIIAGSVKAFVCITPPKEGDSQVSPEDAYNNLSNAVMSGEFSIEYNSNSYAASAITLLVVDNQTPTQSSTAMPPTVRSSPITPLTIIVLSIIAALFVTTFLSVCVWKNKKTATTIAPAPGATPREGALPGEVYMVRKGERTRGDMTAATST
ncbi:leishmanolysin-like peptidase 2 [Strongylocentrotus purpuratus]|uniref:Leishmanolysin-like peptidase n=1 Tax=Strongylocentrotus purpuratus TaxID=7668 RepID=A0A7M7PRB2_STRPU|nr:leishmanolysin-like peptidase 2 [Strongylocentrotus purpuratus]